MASTIAILSSLASVVEHSQWTATQPSSIFSRWRRLPEIPNRLASFSRSLRVLLPQKFFSFRMTIVFFSQQLRGYSRCRKQLLELTQCGTCHEVLKLLLIVDYKLLSSSTIVEIMIITLNQNHVYQLTLCLTRHL